MKRTELDDRYFDDRRYWTIDEKSDTPLDSDQMEDLKEHLARALAGRSAPIEFNEREFVIKSVSMNGVFPGKRRRLPTGASVLAMDEWSKIKLALYSTDLIFRRKGIYDVVTVNEWHDRNKIDDKMFRDFTRKEGYDPNELYLLIPMQAPPLNFGGSYRGSRRRSRKRSKYRSKRFSGVRNKRRSTSRCSKRTREASRFTRDRKR
jgi:hypothetical protein